MYFGNILIFVSLATLCGASKGNKVVNEVKIHLNNLKDNRPKTGPRDCKSQTRGCTYWPGEGEKVKGEKTPGYNVDFEKGRYASLGSFHKLRFHFLSFFDHVLSLHFYCSKCSTFLTTYPLLNAIVICEGSLKGVA